ncbi:MAG: TRAP transporter substrate-binding protein DctP [Planctomycetaceae bacterium]|nr:TRAP transporter substrate-binding protein DctP [Planctomycetaceae bacterium]
MAVVLAAGMAWMASAGERSITIKLPSISVKSTLIAGQEIMNFNWAAQLAFKNYVESNVSGVTVELYANAQLGNGPEILQQCMQRVVEATTTGEADLSSYYSELQIFSVPFLFRNRMEFYTMLDSDFMQRMYDDIAAKTRIRIIASFDNGGFRNISNNVREVKSAADLKGLKIRCMEIPAHLRMFEALGALPTPIPFSELYTALQTGTVDGQENSAMVMMDGSIYEVQKFYTLDGHLISPAYIAVNEDWLASLTPELRKLVLDAGKVAQMAARGAINASESMALDQMRAFGTAIYSPTAEEKASFGIAREPVVAWLKEQISPDLVDEYLNVARSIQSGTYQAAATVSPAAASATVAAGADTMGYIVAIVVLAIIAAILIMMLVKKNAASR